MIRQETLKNVRQKIQDHKRFGIPDFAIIAEGDKLTIRYEYDQNYFLEVKIPDRTSTISQEKRQTEILRTTYSNASYEEYKFDGKYCPGTLTLSEFFSVLGENNFYKLINNWLDNLWEELLAIPVNRQMENQEKILQDIKDKLNDIPDTYFDKEEAEALKTKIDELEKRFEEKLGVEISDKKALKKQLDELHAEFENLKATLHSVKRGGWYKSFFTKTFVWLTKEENRKFLKETKDFILPLLPENIKDIHI
ncbi:MAG: hypothetical protein U0T73_02770 [Chitinophagales bacterium]